MTDAQQSDQPTAFEMLEGVLLLITGVTVSAPMLPGFLLTVPVLVSVTIVALLPVVALALVAALIGTIVMVPVLLVRSLGNLRLRLTTHTPRRSPRMAPNM